MSKRNRIAVGLLLGAIGGYLIALGVGALFTGLAAETNATIREQFRSNPSYLREAAALEELHWRIARGGGLRGFLASKILENGGLGYPEVNKAAPRVWFLAITVGAVIGIAAAVNGWLGLLGVLAAVVWGTSAQGGPVAIATIGLGGAGGGLVAIATLAGIDLLKAYEQDSTG